MPETHPDGRITSRERSVRVSIPKGVTEAQLIRLAGQGAQGVAGGPPGDLFLEVAFEPHPLFGVDGRNITLELPITPWEAALGATVTVPTLGGKVDLKIPAGSQSGRKMRLKGRGLPGKLRDCISRDVKPPPPSATPPPTSGGRSSTSGT